MEVPDERLEEAVQELKAQLSKLAHENEQLKKQVESKAKLPRSKSAKSSPRGKKSPNALSITIPEGRSPASGDPVSPTPSRRQVRKNRETMLYGDLEARKWRNMMIIRLLSDINKLLAQQDEDAGSDEPKKAQSPPLTSDGAKHLAMAFSRPNRIIIR